MTTQAPTDADMAAMTLKMIERLDLKGHEVPDFVAVSNWLTAQLDGLPGGEEVEASPARRGMGAI